MPFFKTVEQLNPRIMLSVLEFIHLISFSISYFRDRAKGSGPCPISRLQHCNNLSQGLNVILTNNLEMQGMQLGRIKPLFIIDLFNYNEKVRKKGNGAEY